MNTGSVFNIGVSGLQAAQAGLTTTSHNIANAGTEGFTRQSVIQGSRNPQATGAGFFGQGVAINTVRRQYSEFLAGQVLAAQTQASHLKSFLAQASQLDGILADPAAGMSPAIQDFFGGVQDVAANPASVPSRQAMISLGQSMVARFQSLDARFNEIRDGVNSAIDGTVREINAFAQQIAKLNNQILSSGNAPTTPANDLLDQRDQLVSQLNELVRVSVVPQSDGSYNVFIGTGQSLVVGAQALSLEASVSPEDPQGRAIGYAVAGTSVSLPPSSLQGGALGGLLAFRSEALDPAVNQLGRVAAVLANTFNQQMRLGQDLRGNLGGDFFAAPQATVQARTTNSGSGVLAATLSDPGQLVASDYRFTFSAGSWIVDRLSDGTSQTFASLPQTLDGVTVNLASGTPAAGDSFLVMPTRYVARDMRVSMTDTARIAAAGPVRTAVTLGNQGDARISSGVVTSVTNLPLAGAVTLTYVQSTNEFTVAGAVPAAGPFTYTSGSTIAFNGMEFQISGTPRNGDTFTLANNANGVADNRNALRLAGLQTANTVAGGTASYQGAYSKLVSDVGIQTRESQIQSTAQESLLKQTTVALQGVSGVNLDEEAANLVRYQQAYQASGKVLQIASTLFDTLLALGGR
jgi:flagellar hook-associated protein 1 FlgK